MLTVNDDVSSVSSDLFGGRLFCPGCGWQLRPWGWARQRLIRHGIGSDQALVREHPRRGRCVGCGATHVLLSVNLAARRADGAAVIAAAIEAKTAHGVGHRVIASRLGRPISTVRGWLRAFTWSAAAMTQAFTACLGRDAPDPAALWPAQASTAAGQAVSVVMAYSRMLTSRFGVVMVPWHSAGLATVGPWFFSAAWWAPKSQHQLALGAGTPVPRLWSGRQPM